MSQYISANTIPVFALTETIVLSSDQTHNMSLHRKTM